MVQNIYWWMAGSTLFLFVYRLLVSIPRKGSQAAAGSNG
jgi:hypothetical protein